MAKKPSEEKLTPDQAWEVIEPRITQYYKAARLVIWVVAGLISVFVSAIVALLALPNVKREVVRALLIKIEDQLVYEETKTAFKSEMEKSLKDPFLPTQFESYLRTATSKAFEDRFARNWKEEMNNIVAYSYSTVFALNDSRKIYDLRYIKPDGNTGKIECTAIYPSKDVRNPVRLTLNNQEDPETTIVPVRDRVGKGKIAFHKSNSEQFAPGSKASVDQKVTIQVDDVPAFQGTIWLDCSVMVNGPPLRLSQ